MEQTPPELLEKIGLTGAATFLGGLVLKRLAEMPTVKEIHVFDIVPPQARSPKIVFHRLDLTRDRADSELAALLVSAGVRTFVHGALHSGPGRRPSAERELESIGTFHVLNALAEAGIEKLVVHSSTFVYGAHAKQPNFVLENQALRSLGPAFVRTRVDVERQIIEFSAQTPRCAVTVLRFAPILGPNSNNIRARYFIIGVIPKLLGYDPLLQFIHEDDAIRAQLLALQSKATGAFNIVGRGVLPLSTGIHLSGKLPVPVPTPLCRSIFSVGHFLRIWDLPSELVPFFQYLCVADGQKAERVLGFRARFSSRQALKSMIEAHRLRHVGFAVPSAALGEEALESGAGGFDRVD